MILYAVLMLPLNELSTITSNVKLSTVCFTFGFRLSTIITLFSASILQYSAVFFISASHLMLYISKPVNIYGYK